MWRAGMRGLHTKSPPPGHRTWRAKTEREGFEPPSPFGRSLSRRVQYHSASAPGTGRGRSGQPPGPRSEEPHRCTSADPRIYIRMPVRPVVHGLSAVNKSGRPDGPRHARSSRRNACRPRSRITALAPRLEPSVRTQAPYQTAPPSAASTNRGARIRTGDLCDPNAALYRTEPRPGSYSGQARQKRGCETRAPRARLGRAQLARPTHPWNANASHSRSVGSDPTLKPTLEEEPTTDGVGFEPTRA